MPYLYNWEVSACFLPVEFWGVPRPLLILSCPCWCPRWWCFCIYTSFMNFVSPLWMFGVHIIWQKPHAQILSKCGFVTEIRLHVNYRNLLNSFCKALLFVFDSGVWSSWGKHSGREDGCKVKESKNKLESTSARWAHEDRLKPVQGLACCLWPWWYECPAEVGFLCHET